MVAIIDCNAPIVHLFVDENGRNVTVNGTCYLDLLNEEYEPPFSFISNSKKVSGCMTALRHPAQQKLKVFLLESSLGSGADRLAAESRSDGLFNCPISTPWISIFGHWPRGVSTQQNHLPLSKRSILVSSICIWKQRSWA